MKIYSMTATFGKLEHETLTLQPGLNVIYAPNEWGKSTWCAFLLAMLYGLDTRAKTTKTALADKERYVPWSGSPMEGRIDLNWNGRDITIERSTRGRIPMGYFRAYETDTGIEVPELNGVNCGQQLLGVEQSIFRRSGFIRLTDLPVTQDDALRARLNALVTTGDESDDAVRLAEALRDLKNRCRYNRTGLLPQAMAQRESLETRLDEMTSMQQQCDKLEERQREIDEWIEQLERHRNALEYEESQEDARRVAEAREAWDQQVRRMEAAEAACAKFPPKEKAEEKAQAIRAWQQLQRDALTANRVMPDPPQMQQTAPVFQGLSAREAVEKAAADAEVYERMHRSRGWLIWPVLALLWAAVGGLLYWLEMLYLAIAAGVIGLFCLICCLFRIMGQRFKAAELEELYGNNDPVKWQRMAEGHEAACRIYEREKAEYTAAKTRAANRTAALEKQREQLCGSRSPEEMLDVWQHVLRRWEEYADARSDAAQAEKHYRTLRSMAKPGRTAVAGDTLTCSRQETEDMLQEAQTQRERLHGRLNQYQGRMEALGDAAALRSQVEQAQRRIEKLEDYYAALTIAQETLSAATVELQRRFAPRISKRAEELLTAMTDGRYDRLVISEDFSLRAGAQREDTLHDALWRSDGTVDQLYLALRMAVSEALIPEAPLILDDALVRFDDSRMEAALKLLDSTSESRQVILFSCQKRERDAVEACGTAG